MRHQRRFTKLGSIVLVAATSAAMLAACAAGDTATENNVVNGTGTGTSAGGASSSGSLSVGTGTTGTGTGQGGSASSGGGSQGSQATTSNSGSGGNGSGTGGNSTANVGSGGNGGAGGSGGTVAGTGGCAAQPEQCNGLDDNCNGDIDEEDPEGGAECDANAFGECAKGHMHCVNGALKCQPGSQEPETCDGLDNNCDGNVDEGNPGGGTQCSTPFMGICSTGITKCDGDNGVICKPNVTPGQLSEACNGIDDDCNGLTDDSIAQVGQDCTAMGFLGICQFGKYVCPAAPPFQITCNHPAPSTVQETCNGKDDDCNGTIDDPGLVNGVPCNTGFEGVCATGTVTCVTGSVNCVPDVDPGSQTEICNDEDDDCDGNVDEMNATVACQSQNPSASFVQSWACDSGNCSIDTCVASHSDLNGAQSDGCECATDSWANDCSTASALAVGVGAQVNMVGTVETANGEDWVTFNFTNKGGGENYHPRVELVDSAGGQYAMDVYQSCGSIAQCSTTGGGNNENGNNVNVWEQNYNFSNGPGCCSDNYPRALSVKVRVFRKNGDTPTCNSYTVTATNP